VDPKAKKSKSTDLAAGVSPNIMGQVAPNSIAGMGGAASAAALAGLPTLNPSLGFGKEDPNEIELVFGASVHSERIIINKKEETVSGKIFYIIIPTKRSHAKNSR
jgi:hypothetical protein